MSSEVPATEQTIGRAIVVGGMAVLLHAAYGVVGQVVVPASTQLQCAAALLMGGCGVVIVGGKLQPISLSAILDGASASFDEFNPDFMVFHHRGRCGPKSGA